MWQVLSQLAESKEIFLLPVLGDRPIAEHVQPSDSLWNLLFQPWKHGAEVGPDCLWTVDLRVADRAEWCYVLVNIGNPSVQRSLIVRSSEVHALDFFGIPANIIFRKVDVNQHIPINLFLSNLSVHGVLIPDVKLVFTESWHGCLVLFNEFCYC